MKTIGDRIRERRKELDMSAEDMAERLGKNRATIYRYESGDIKTLPSDVLEPIARVLQTTPADLLGYSDPRETSQTEPFSENEIKLINKYRDLDDHGKDMVDTVADKEYERCQEEKENTVVIDREFLKGLPFEERLGLVGQEEEYELRRVARRRTQ